MVNFGGEMEKGQGGDSRNQGAIQSPQEIRPLGQDQAGAAQESTVEGVPFPATPPRPSTMSRTGNLVPATLQPSCAKAGDWAASANPGPRTMRSLPLFGQSGDRTPSGVWRLGDVEMLPKYA